MRILLALLLFPVLALADGFNVTTSPGGTTGQVQYNNAGAFGGATLGSNLAITGGTLTLTNVSLTTGNLSQFAATTSAQFLGVISDELGSGKVVADTGTVLTSATLTTSTVFTTTTGTATVFAEAANTLALRNSTNAQTFNVYNSYTDASNYSLFCLGNDPTAGPNSITARGLGTGVNPYLQVGTVGTGYLYFFTNNVVRWKIDGSTGHLLANVDNTYDIGASGATRPRDIYAGRHVVVSGTLILSGTAAVPTNAVTPVAWGVIQAPSGTAYKIPLYQ